MYTRIFVKIFLSVLFCFSVFSHSFSQDSQSINPKYLEPGYYAVVGVFKYEKNAQSLTSQMIEKGEFPEYAFYPPRGYYYVQIGKFDSFQKARIKVLKSREKEDMDSTWVYKAVPFSLKGGEVIGGDIRMDAGVGLSYEMKSDTAQVVEVYPGGSSEKAGIKLKDKIVSVDDSNVAGVELTEIEVQDLLHGIEGSEVKIAVMREGRIMEFNLTRDDFDNAEKTLGIKFQIRNDTVFVTQVDPGGAAGSVIKSGDKLIEVGGKKISGVSALAPEVEKSLSRTDNSEVKVTLIRDGKIQDHTIIQDGSIDPKIYLGIDYDMVEDTLVVTRVDEGSKAEELGLKTGDLLVEIGQIVVSGKEKSLEDITSTISEAIEEGAVITVIRDGESQEYTLSKEELLDPKMLLGMDYVLRNDTLFITRVDNGSEAERAGLKKGDKLIDVGDEKVAGQNKSEEDLNKTIATAVSAGVMVTVMRDGLERDFFIRPENFDISSSAGIGILFDIQSDTAFVKRVIEGSSSEALGLLPGDKILKIGNEPVTGINADSKKITNKLTGAEGSSVDLTILRHGEVKEYSATRKVLVAGAHIDRLDAGKFSGIMGRTVEEKLSGKILYLNTVRATSYTEVPGIIEVINSEKAQLFAIKNAHEIIGIPYSINRSGNISLISEIFGYKKIQHDFNLKDPFNEMTEGFLSMEDTVLVVTFELQRITKGDLVTMYNVYFFKDAAIMRPESQYEAQQLLYMLKENPDYEISIQGHTNGNSKGPIIEMEEGSTSYFSREGPTKESFGSAKKLSESRANMIRDYLISNGIDASRIQTIGYGGKKSIYGKLDNLAYKNVRVEIEILAD